MTTQYQTGWMGRVCKIFDRCISPQARAIVATRDTNERLAVLRRAEEAAEERQMNWDEAKKNKEIELPEWIRKDPKLAKRTLAALKAKRKAGL